MPAQKRRNLLARRRRHDDEGEEDGSAAGDVPEYASSEGSFTSDAEEDGDVSANSIDEDNAHSSTLSPVLPRPAAPADVSNQEHSFRTSTDTTAMFNGLKIQDGEEIEELDFDEAVAGDGNQVIQYQQVQEQQSRSQPTQPKSQRTTGQTFNQPRKGYSFHDDRAKERNSIPQPPFRGRGRGFGGPSNKSFGSFPNDTPRQWTHDLHEMVNQPESPNLLRLPSQPVAVSNAAPNRSFSTTTVLGNVPVHVSIPGNEKKSSASMIKKHYTLLPQHRPPLRRDKPVRISIPDENPRYIFPSTERSFIFIPRAMRPNQQQFRGRARGSFHGSRRTSIYGGSAYTPSIGMSRRPSITASNTGSGIQTPTGIPMPQYPMAMQKPVVRMPTYNHHPYPLVSTTQNVEVYMGDNSAIIHSPPATLPMHQPVPQKAVSVADIESPAIGAPQQQAQQPFHQQIPSHMQEAQAQPKMPHIPEGAVYAQPFQPYPAMPQSGFYGMPYPGSMMMMMMQPTDTMTYAMGVGGPVIAPMQQPANTGPDAQQQGPVAHESNGMVYYYSPSQQYAPPPLMNMSMMQPGPYFYPAVQNQVFYQ